MSFHRDAFDGQVSGDVSKQRHHI